MKTTLKVFAWTLTSLIIIALIVIAVLINWVFTPEKITPFVQKQLNEMLTCETKVDRVELTFFSTFPEFALHLHGLSLVQPMEGAPSDTLLRAASACVAIDIEEFMNNNAVVVRELLLTDALVMLYTNAEGVTNYSVMSASGEPEDTMAFSLPFSRLEIEKIELTDSRIGYYDIPMKLQADMDDVRARMTVNGKEDLFKGILNLQTASLLLVYDSVAYLDNIPASISTSYSFEMNRFLLQLPDAETKLNELPLELSVLLENTADSGNLLLDISFASAGKLKIKPLLDMIPDEYASYLDGISLDGKASLTGLLKGIVNEYSLPHLVLNIELDNGSFAYEGMPYKLREMKGKADVIFDLNDEKSWYIVVNDFDARTMNSRISGSGKVVDLMGDMRFDIKATGMLSLADVSPVLPDDMDVDLSGIARGNLDLQFRLSEMIDFRFDRIMTTGSFSLSDFKARYDTLNLASRAATLNFSLPNPGGGGAGFASLKLKSERLDIEQGKSVKAMLKGVNIGASTSNLMDSTLAMIVQVDGSIEEVDATMGEEHLTSGATQLVASIAEDKQAEGKSLQWIPNGFIRFKDGLMLLSGMDTGVKIPNISFDFTPDGIIIHDSRMEIGYSDFQLTGTLTNLDAYLNDAGLLKGNFDFVSSTTDVNHLMELINGFGYEEEAGGAVQEAESAVLSGPFMVPRGVDVTLNVRVDEAFVSTDVLSDVRGTLTLKDGMLGLESVLFTASAARMQLNALYHTPRRNHLFVGLDFHLTHIEIEELLMMIPDIDTIMPMLRSFGGRGEFHIAAETYLDSTYNFKPSTLLGVASISGEDLVLMDGETFSEIAKILMFNKKTENKIDSIAAEFTIFQSEVDIYPFQIVMDKYKAVVSGKHNLDMNFNYHISVTDSPVPIQFGVDVSGNLDDLKIRPAKPRYARLYRPAQRREIDRRQLQIKQMIRETLTRGLSDQNR